MKAAEFNAVLPKTGFNMWTFAAYVDVDYELVRCWGNGSQDIPRWVPIMLGLMIQVGDT